MFVLFVEMAEWFEYFKGDVLSDVYMKHFIPDALEVLEELRWTGESGFGDDKDVDLMLVDSFGRTSKASPSFSSPT